MPTYEYVCEKCGHRFEAFQRMTEEKLTDCPLEGCDGTVRRLLGTGAGIIFKGGGFYETDYRSESYKSGEKKETESSQPKEKKESKTDGGKESGGSKKSDAGASTSGGESAPKKAD